MKHIAFLILLALHLNVSAQTLKTLSVEYKDHDVTLDGYLAYDPAVRGKRPIVLVVHEWKGINDYVKKRCDQLATMGYVVFAPDIYGKGVRPESAADAGKEATKYKSDRKLMQQRMIAGLNKAKTFSEGDTSKIVVIGYCFGGTAALELGRSGADVDGIVSFHGGLNNPDPANAAKIKAKVLVCHGAIDPNVPVKEVQTFMEEMNQAKVDYQFIAYSGAVHAFTNPSSGNDVSKGAAYNKTADERSWQHMLLFFREVLN